MQPEHAHGTHPAYAGARQLSPWSILAALGASIGLSIAAHVHLFQSSFVHETWEATDGLVNGTWIANVLLLALVVGCVLVGFGGARARELALDARDLLPALLVTSVTWVLLHAGLVLATVLAGRNIEPSALLADGTHATSAAGALLGQLFGNALYEELLFRAVLLGQLSLFFARRRYPLLLALVVSQAIFALQHVPNRIVFDQWDGPVTVIIDLALLFVAGLFHAGVWLRTRNLLLTVGLHALSNTPTLLLSGRETWVHPAVMAIAFVGVLVLGPRLTRK